MTILPLLRNNQRLFRNKAPLFENNPALFENTRALLKKSKNCFCGFEINAYLCIRTPRRRQMDLSSVQSDASVEAAVRH